MPKGRSGDSHHLACLLGIFTQTKPQGLCRHLKEGLKQCSSILSKYWRVCLTQVAGPHPLRFLIGQARGGVQEFAFPTVFQVLLLLTQDRWQCCFKVLHDQKKPMEFVYNNILGVDNAFFLKFNKCYIFFNYQKKGLFFFWMFPISGPTWAVINWNFNTAV